MRRNVMTGNIGISILLIIAVLLFPILSACTSYCPKSLTGTNENFGTTVDKGCKTYAPSDDPLKEYAFRSRGETKTKNGITVTAAVLTDYESERIFGVRLDDDSIQPVWLKIENSTDKDISFVHTALDPGYYSPFEAAYMNYTMANPVNEEMTEYFDQWSIDRDIPAGGEISGFIFTRWDPGIKYINVVIYGEDRTDAFVFYTEIPGITTDYARVDWDNLYEEKSFVEFDDERELLKVLSEMPCCTTKKDGSGENDPLNFILIGDADDIFSAFMRRGWDVTEPITIRSGLRAAKSFFSGGRYRTSPMSSLFYYQRKQDIGLQKARSTIHERNHLRLWLTPYIFRGKEVWIGAVSRDIGSYLTTKTPWLTAHAIDPDLDEARDYLLQDLVVSSGVRKIGYIQAIEPADPENPHRNFMDQPWWTDGLRAVILFENEPTGIEEIELLDWEW